MELWCCIVNTLPQTSWCSIHSSKMSMVSVWGIRCLSSTVFFVTFWHQSLSQCRIRAVAIRVQIWQPVCSLPQIHRVVHANAQIIWKKALIIRMWVVFNVICVFVCRAGIFSNATFYCSKFNSVTDSLWILSPCLVRIQWWTYYTYANSGRRDSLIFLKLDYMPALIVYSCDLA